MKQIAKFFFFICASLLLAPLSASAHVKWFAESVGTIEPYKISDIPVLLWLAAGICIILLGIKLEKKLHVPQWFHTHMPRFTPAILSLASIGFGAAFLIFSLNGFIFAPNLPAVGSMGTLLLALQAIAGIMMLFGFYERVGGILLLVLFALSVKQFGAIEMLDTLEMVGMALYAIIIGRPKWRLAEAHWIKRIVHRVAPYAVPVLRVATGLNLLVLGFTEKILAPELTQNFLAHYHWNFMDMLGFHFFTNYWFAFSAGVVESLIGIFLIFGLITRTTTLILACFLVTTLALLGPTELIGHLPHFSIAIVLLTLGAGSKLKLLRADW